MSNNFFKSNTVVREGEVRIINSNDIVARKMESIAQYVREHSEDELENVFSEGIEAKEVAVLIQESEEDFQMISNMPLEKGSAADVLKDSKTASDIIQQASLEAQQILSDAKKEAMQLKIEAMRVGREQGHAEGLKAGQEEIARQSQELEQKKKALEDEYRNAVEEIEPGLVDAITGVYEHIFGVILDEHREIVVHLVNSTLFQMEGVKKFLLHVSKDDYPYISMQKKELVAGTGIAVENVEIVEDFSMKKGQCMIETEGAIFECGFKTQMEQLRKELKMLSYEQN